MNSIMTAWRVTGWDSETRKELIVGVFLADFREDAIRQAGKDPRAKYLVLDACRAGGQS